MFDMLKNFLGRLETKKIEKWCWGWKNGLFSAPVRTLPHNSTRYVWAENLQIVQILQTFFKLYNFYKPSKTVQTLQPLQTLQTLQSIQTFSKP